MDKMEKLNLRLDLLEFLLARANYNDIEYFNVLLTALQMITIELTKFENYVDIKVEE